MVLRYKDNPNIIGWQLGNEFGGDRYYCGDCANAFREWLRRKYRSLSALGKACGLIFWGQEYESWDEILPPRPPLVMQNPSLTKHCLDL